MSSQIVPIIELPADPLDAAAEFHSRELPRVRDNMAVMWPPADVVLVFKPAGQEHHAWRLAVVQGLARELAPIRVNAVVGDDEVAVDNTVMFLNEAPGITGQLLAV